MLDSSGVFFRFRILSFLTAQKGRKNAPPESPFFRIACSPVLEIRQQADQRGPSAALPGIARHCDVQGVRLAPRFARALHLGLFALPDPCLPAVLPDHSLPVSVPSGLASQASHSPDGLRGELSASVSPPCAVPARTRRLERYGPAGLPPRGRQPQTKSHGGRLFAVPSSRQADG
ncbi:hypothetical protein Selin_1848 [Desulfurispirillum indicum S5]|uniref:Uncharacterized protein n=1 Tax=Desulfurispirillum indicum (strain ATCC BAA-1389 / DSM 22839 / S5) TaxID=653733 RepID=E6W1M6_DESIS|nr:hypothetical protein Selin_1848 [Desulfurispirillum indicum S5]